MAQPSFVPITEADQVRPTMAQPSSTGLSGRPAEQRSTSVPHGGGFGSPGPDGGYAITLAHRLADRMVLTEGEDRHDVEIGAGLLAARRASFFGRGPCVYDVEVALGLFGFLAPAPEDLIEYRRILFQAIGHQWMAQRALVDGVPETALRLSPADAAASAESWRQVLGV